MKKFNVVFVTLSVLFSVTNLITKLRSLVILFLLTVMLGVTTQAQWVQTGLGGGGIYTLTDTGTGLFAGTNTGVSLTTTNGASWTSLNTGLTNTSVRAIALSGSNLVAGTAGGVFYSANNGSNWNSASNGLTNLNVQALTYQGANLFAGTFGGGIFISSNNGTNWSSANTGLTNLFVYTFAINGANLFAGTNNGVFLSTNNGTSWSQVSTGLTNTDVRALAFSGTNLFAGSNGGGIFLTTNDGANWTQMNTGLTNSNISSFVVCGTNLYTGTNGGIFQSFNNGNSWNIYNSGLTNTTVTALAVSSTRLYAGTLGGGVFSSNSCDVAASATVTPGGPDRVCQSASPSAITLSGASVGGSATTGAWSITSGGGTLSDYTQTGTPSTVTYTPDANYSGTVTLTLTSNGSPAATGTRSITVSALPAIAVITGTTTICVGSTTQLADATAGGTWSSGSEGVATISAGSAMSGPGGLVTGISVGTTIITYTVRDVAGCTNSVTQTVTVSGIPTITGTTPGSNCGTGSVTLGATASSGTINWYAASTGGTSLGTGTSYTTPSISTTTTYYVDATDACGTTAVRTAVTATVNTPITYYLDADADGYGGSTTLQSCTIPPPGYVTVPGDCNDLVATIHPGATEVCNGIDDNCNAIVDETAPTTANAGADQTGAATCGLTTTTLAGNNPSVGTGAWTITSGTGGTFTNSALYNTTFTGTVGTAYTLRWTISNAPCPASTDEVLVTFNQKPILTGTTPASRCGTGTVTLGATASAGTINWYAALTGGSSLGTGTSYTTSVISSTTTYYVDATDVCGTTASRTAVVATINALPVVSAPASVAVGSTITLSPTTGGTWTSSDQLIATVTNSGVVTGVSAGTATFTFTSTVTGCSATTSSVTVGSDCVFLSNTDFESPVVGPSVPGYYAQGYIQTPEVNVPSWHTTASDGKIEIWDGRPTAMNVAAASGNQFAELNCTQLGTLYQTFTSIANQQVLISFAHRGRYAGLDKMEVQIGPSGGTYITIGTFYDNLAGGWNHYSIPYTLPTGGLYQIRFVSIYSNGGDVVTPGGNFLDEIKIECLKPNDATVTPGGPDAVCQSASPAAIILSGASVGGSATTGAWSITLGGGTLSSTAQTTSPASVTYTPAANYTGTVILKLTTNSSPAISATRTITVNALPAAPAAITGTLTVCVGSTTQLADATTGGTWTSGSLGVATVNASTGLVTGVSAGTALITYTTGGVVMLCTNSVTQTVTVNASPTISGTSPAARCGTGTVILGATASSGTINWYAALTGGTSLGTGIAFTTPSISSTTSYWVEATSNSCTSSRTEVVATVNALPTIAAITGTLTVCVGSTTQLADATTGGTWTSGNLGVATVNASTGLVTGVSAGTALITYTIGGVAVLCSNSVTQTVTVNTSPTITGTTPASRCGTGTVTLGATASAGIINWYDALTGGNLVGTGNSYTTPSISTTTTYYVDATSGGCTTGTRTAVVATVNSIPVVSAPVSVSVGSTANLSPNTGGTWTSSNQSVATVSASGLVTGVSAGTVTYIFTNTITGCSAITSSMTVTATGNKPCIYLNNTDFEQFLGATPPTGYYWFPQANIPFWNTTATDGKIEIWHSGFGNVPAHSGTYFAEINATQNATLYQTFTATTAQTVIVSFWHRGRYLGVDVMKVLIVSPGGTPTTLGTFSDNNSAWNFYTVSYPITTPGTYTLKFESVSSNNGTGPLDGGNFLDDINVTCPSSICGIKYNDLNSDGQKQATEPVIPNWEIKLTGPLTMSATTGADGSYCFNNLPAGSYTVQETQQSGWVQTAPATPGTYSVNIIEGQNILGKDFGNRQLTNSSCTDFEDGTNGGWQVSNTLSSIALDGTNHYLHTTDQSGASALFNESKPLTGDWTNLLVNGCGSLCFDINFLLAGIPYGGVNPPSTFTPYFSISGNGFSAYFMVTNPISAGSGWHTYCAPLAYLNLDGTLPSNSDGHWVMGAGSNSDWNTMLSNVTRVNLPVDPTSYQCEQFGYDNICLKNTGDCITLCCDKVTVAPVLDATGKATCSAKVTATCEVKSIDVTVTNGTLGSVNWNCTNAVPTGYIGQSTYTFAPGSCFPEMTTSVNAITSGIVTITYDITFSSGEKCQKKIELRCGVPPPSCCEQVKVERVIDAAGKSACSAKITTNCEVKAIAVTVTNGTLNSVNWNCTTAIPTGYIGQSSYTFGPGNCNPVMTTSVDATTSGIVTITYDITFSNGEKCQKKVDLDCSVPTAVCCDKVKVEPVVDATGKASCCAKITATCEVKSIAVIVSNGTLSSASWNCPTTIPTGYVGQTAYTFAPESCTPEMTTCVDAIKSGMVTITYDIVFTNGETCQKTIRLDCAVPSDCVTPPTGMVLWLPGDGNANDISGLNNHGTLAGGTTYSTGKVAGAFKVGNYMDQISVADNSSLNFGTGNFSADAWFKTTDNVHAISIVDKSVPVGNNMTGYRLFIIQGKLYFQMGDGTVPLSQWVPTVQLADGAWHFVTVTIDRKFTDGGKLYIDGSLALTFDPTGKPGSISNTIPLTVAGNNMSNLTASDNFTFYLDEVELFNRAITDTEIASIYNAGSAGKCKLGSICGTKFNDLNGNGQRDKDEPGIAEWTITIGGTADLTAMTDRDGNYCFYNLQPGEYKIGEGMRAGWQQMVPAAPGTYTITLPAGQNLTGLDFGNRLIPQTGSICGSKFNDLNGNGRRDDGEPVLSGWNILLSGAAEMNVLTNEKGEYCFDNLKPGTYKIGEENRLGWLQMKPVGGSYNVVLAAGDHLIDQDFGNMLDSKPASICGIKFNDLNGNGSQDLNEPGLPNWTINLTGSATMTAITNGKGKFCFTGLKAGAYTVSEVNQPLWHQTAPRPTGTYTITLISGEYLENQNFGNQHDLECVTPPVGMLGWWPGDDNANDITLNGNFGTLVNGATFAPGKVGSAFSLMGSTDYVNIPDRPQLNPGSGDFTIDCWIKTSEATGTYAILDKRALDANQQISGYGLYVVNGYLQFRLSDSAGNGFAAAIFGDNNTTMIADGQWHFVAAKVEQGDNHAVTVSIDGVVGFRNTWGYPNLTYSNTVALRIGEAYFSAYSNNSPAGHYHNFQGMIDEVEFIYGALSDAELVGIYNAGSAGKCKPTVLLGTICGTKFNDLNGNGIRDARGDGEPGIQNWTIKLTGAATMTTTTDANGNFCFNNLPAGQYTIAEVNQDGWIQTTPLNPNTFTVTLTPGGHIEVLNFGNKIDPTFGCVQAPSGLVGWWPGDGHARDISGLNNHGTLEGGASYVSGKVDQAFSFSNHYDEISIPNSASINFGEDNFSIDAWVKTTDNINQVGIVMKTVFASAYTNTGSILYSWQIGYGLRIYQGKLSFVMGDNSSLPFINFEASATAGLITDGKWHFVAVTVDRKNSSGGKLYMDGNLVLTFDPTSRSGSLTYSNDLRIGYHHANTFNNQIDEVELFNRALTGAEIASIYKAGSSGKCKLGTICGMKFNDLNGNGRKDQGEPGIADWQINLSGTADMSVFTDKEGRFCFTNLNPGEYQIGEEIRDGWIQVTPINQGKYTVTLPAGGNLTGYYFGNKLRNPTSCVEPPSGMVAWWAFDETSGTTATDLAGTNNIGTLTNGPIPVVGKVLKGLHFDGVDDYVEAPDQPELNFGTGDFSFDAWIQTTDDQIYGAELIDKRTVTTNGLVGYSFLLVNGKLSLQLAENWTSYTTYGSQVFVADGKWHHIAITVSRKDQKGILFYLDGVETQYGDPTLHPGPLTNSGPLKIGSQSHMEGYFFNGILDEIELFNRVITKAEIVSIFNAGSSGKCKLGSICGTKFNDLNGNGRRDDGEPGIPEWQIMLDGTARLTAITDKDGNYCFTNLVPGDYKIVEGLRPDWQQKMPASGYYAVALEAGKNISRKDFGNMLNSQLGSICGMKYNDLNGNGKRDEGEPGISDWTILIGGTADFSMVTDKNGEFCFTNLKPGVYKIGEQSRQGWVQTAPSEHYFTIELKAGEHITKQEFGNILDPITGSICGMKFNDANGNGIMDGGELGIPDWTINLAGTAIKTITTGADGSYCFNDLTAGNYSISEVNQSNWYPTVPLNPSSYTITLAAGQLLKNQDFGNTTDPCVSGIKSWSALGTNTNNGPNDYVLALAVNGADLYVGGKFNTVGGVSAINIAKWNGYSWSALGSGLVGYSANTLAVFGGELYAGGSFNTAGGVSANLIAKWDGINWSTLGSGLVGYSANTLAMIGGNLYVGGNFWNAGGITANSLAKWDGSNWSAIGTGIGANGEVNALAVMGGNLYAGGDFSTIDGVSANKIAKWDGTSWSSLGSGINNGTNGRVRALAVIGSTLYASGYFTTAGGLPSTSYIAKWDGTSWSSCGLGIIGNGHVSALNAVGSDLYAGGNFRTAAGGANANDIAKWDGTSWSTIGANLNANANALAMVGNDLFVGGDFTTAGGVNANNIAKYSCDVPTSVNEVQLQQPYNLEQNYPNPFSSASTIGYTIPQTSQVKIIVYDLFGKEIKVLVNEEKAPGHHEIVFERKDFVSGIYFYTLKTAGFTQSKKMILMK
ncbi:MAG: SdrD B-like domain-containing protein [Bacteroidota bacterium]|nr:SdrD B-like domain-containing protein [Bacteroidota bacterium]